MIYFIRSGNKGPIKIGYTDENFDQRFKSLQTGNPYKLKLVGMIEGDALKEAELHRKFEKHHIRGEWFKSDREIIDYIFQNKEHDSIDVSQGIDLPEILENIERQYIEQALDLTNWNQPKAAKLLGISFRSIRYKIDKLRIDKY